MVSDKEKVENCKIRVTDLGQICNMTLLAAYDVCDTPAARGALLRREGLYQARIIAWKHQQVSGKSVAVKSEKNARRVDHLIFEIVQLKKKMAQAVISYHIDKHLRR